MSTAKNNEEIPNAHLHELMVKELQDLLGAEKQLLLGLEKMASAAADDKLKAAFRLHCQDTENHIERLKSAFGALGLPPRGRRCKAMAGLLEAAAEIAAEFQDSPALLDIALIAAAQKMEHYEIASYGCALTYAELMELPEVTLLLGQTLEEERQADELLTEMGLAGINQAQGG